MALKYLIWGLAVVFDADGAEVDDQAILGELAGFVPDEDSFATDFIGGTEKENALAAALDRSGQLRFAYDHEQDCLRVLTEYSARRELNEAEVNLLCEYTLGQWSDGMGECVFVPNGPHAEYKLQPLGKNEVTVSRYPFIHVTPARA
jgi:hypothetical protein